MLIFHFLCHLFLHFLKQNIIQLYIFLPTSSIFAFLTAKSCPALIGTEYNHNWRYTRTIIPKTRAPGTIVSFNCTKEMWRENSDLIKEVNETVLGVNQNLTSLWEVALEARRSSAFVECGVDALGTPVWNDTVELPCVCKCWIWCGIFFFCVCVFVCV